MVVVRGEGWGLGEMGELAGFFNLSKLNKQFLNTFLKNDYIFTIRTLNYEKFTFTFCILLNLKYTWNTLTTREHFL